MFNYLWNWRIEEKKNLGLVRKESVSKQTTNNNKPLIAGGGGGSVRRLPHSPLQTPRYKYSHNHSLHYTFPAYTYSTSYLSRRPINSKRII